MKIAVLGGSFNPIHIGHLTLADEVCVSLGYDKVLFVPTFIPPHKKMSGEVEASRRAQMVKLACSLDERFELETCEIDRGGVSYTFDTITHLEEKYKDVLTDRIGLIMGRDLFSGFHLWQHADLIAEKCTLILAERPYQKEDSAFSNSAVGGYAEYEDSLKKSFDISSDSLFKNAVALENEPLTVSSTNIRMRVAKKMGFQYLVPPGVFKYIVSEKLYEAK